MLMSETGLRNQKKVDVEKEFGEFLFPGDSSVFFEFELLVSSSNYFEYLIFPLCFHQCVGLNARVCAVRAPAREVSSHT